MAPDYASKEIRRVDRWVAYVATHPRVRLGIYVVAALEATISPLLPELVVAAVLSYRKDISWKAISVYSALGSATGAGILYVAGKYFYRTYEGSLGWIVGSQVGAYSERLLEGNVFVSMFLAAFTPLPDRVFALLSGVFALSFPVVIIAFFLGRLIRVGIVAYFSYHFGDEAREYVLKHTRIVTITVVSLIVLYSILKYLAIL
jgi:membrane protein YqaA with SNARE-associated domain